MPSSPCGAVYPQPARHELCPCYVRPIAAAIDEPAFKCLTIPAIRAPRGMNFVHTSRDYPLQDLSNLLPALFYEVALARCKTLKQVWCFTRLLATLWESSSLMHY